MRSGRTRGVYKRCDCKDWTKCRHGWWLNFKWKPGVNGEPKSGWRFPLDPEAAEPIEYKTDAVALAERIRTSIRNGTFRQPAPAAVATEESMSLEAYARDEWLPAARQNLKASTVRFYSDHLEHNIVSLLGSRPIGQIARKDCRDLVTAARSKGLKIATVRGVVRTLSAILSQAVEDEYLPANPALSMRKYLRRGDEPETPMDPFTKDEVTAIVNTTREHFPTWHPWLLCGLRTGMRAGELLALHWGDIDWRGRYVFVQRNLVRGKLTTPKNHQCRRVDLSLELRAVLRLWRRHKSAEWLKIGQPRPDWVFPSSTGTALDESNVRKALNQILDKAELHRRGPHQMRHTFASLLLQAGEPITYVSRQLGHKDSSITLRVYAHWMPDTSGSKGVDRLDSTPAVAQPLHKPRRLAFRRIA